MIKIISVRLKMIFLNKWINFIMAFSTICNTIRNFISQFRKKMPRSNMMSNTIFSFEFGITVLTSLVISIYNRTTPFPVSNTISFSGHSIFIIPSSFTKHRIARSKTGFFKHRFNILTITFGIAKFSLMFARELKVHYFNFISTIKTLSIKITQSSSVSTNCFNNFSAHNFIINQI